MLKKTARMQGFGILFNPEIMTEGEVTYAEGMIAADIIGVYCGDWQRGAFSVKISPGACSR